MSTYSPSLWKILSETWRIIAAHPGHFLALSALFLFPVSISAIVYSFILQPSSVHPHYLQSIFTVSTPDTQGQPPSNSQLLISVLSMFSTLLVSLCANPSITYSTFAAFYGKPVKLILSLKAILVSCLPLLATLVIRQVVLCLIIFTFGVLVLVAYTGIALFVLEMDYDSPYFHVFVVTTAVVIGLVLVYLLVEWCLLMQVVVLESKWGIEPLRRSSYLVTGMRKVALSMIVLFGSIGVVLTMWSWNLVVGGGGAGWVYMHMIVCVVFWTLLSLYSIVAGTVLFIYCKASHGEMAISIDKETGGGYFTLSMV